MTDADAGSAAAAALEAAHARERALLEQVQQPQVVVRMHVRDPYDRELQHVRLRGVATCVGHKGV